MFEIFQNCIFLIYSLYILITLTLPHLFSSLIPVPPLQIPPIIPPLLLREGKLLGIHSTLGHPVLAGLSTSSSTEVHRTYIFLATRMYMDSKVRKDIQMDIAGKNDHSLFYNVEV